MECWGATLKSIREELRAYLAVAVTTSRTGMQISCNLPFHPASKDEWASGTLKAGGTSFTVGRTKEFIMRKVWQSVAVAVVGLGVGLALVGCDSSTPSTKDKMGGDKMNTGKMSGDKMSGEKMNGDKMSGDKKQ
jgi:pentapeptide MXKDX repeat protein